MEVTRFGMSNTYATQCVYIAHAVLQPYHTFPKRCVELQEALKFAHMMASEPVGGTGYAGCAGVVESQRRCMIGTTSQWPSDARAQRNRRVRERWDTEPFTSGSSSLREEAQCPQGAIHKDVAPLRGRVAHPWFPVRSRIRTKGFRDAGRSPGGCR